MVSQKSSFWKCEHNDMVVKSTNGYDNYGDKSTSTFISLEKAKGTCFTCA